MNELTKKAQENAYKLWGEHVSSGYLLYPNEYLTRYIYAHKNEFKKILDFGCGDGRHLEMMARAGIAELIGVDYNACVLKTAKKRCENLGVGCEVFQSDKELNLKELLKEKSVDCVVCWGITHLNAKEITSDFIKQFSGVLNENGEVFANWRTQKDSLYKNGIECEKNTFIIESKSHKGMLYYFPPLDEIKQIYKDARLEILSIDYEEFSTNNATIINSWHIIRARKI